MNLNDQIFTILTLGNKNSTIQLFKKWKDEFIMLYSHHFNTKKLFKNDMIINSIKYEKVIKDEIEKASKFINIKIANITIITSYSKLKHEIKLIENIPLSKKYINRDSWEKEIKKSEYIQKKINSDDEVILKLDDIEYEINGQIYQNINEELKVHNRLNIKVSLIKMNKKIYNDYLNPFIDLNINVDKFMPKCINFDIDASKNNNTKLYFDLSNDSLLISIYKNSKIIYFEKNTDFSYKFLINELVSRTHNKIEKEQFRKILNQSNIEYSDDKVVFQQLSEKSANVESTTNRDISTWIVDYTNNIKNYIEFIYDTWKKNNQNINEVHLYSENRFINKGFNTWYIKNKRNFTFRILEVENKFDKNNIATTVEAQHILKSKNSSNKLLSRIHVKAFKMSGKILKN